MLPTFFTISGEDITDILGYVSDLFSDISPLFLLIVGVGVVLIVVIAIIKALRG